MSRGTASRGNAYTPTIGVRGDKSAYFDDNADAIYDYITDDGYNNLGNWIEAAAKNTINRRCDMISQKMHQF